MEFIYDKTVTTVGRYPITCLGTDDNIELTLSTLSNCNRLFHSLFWKELKLSVGVKGLSLYIGSESLIPTVGLGMEHLA